MKQIKNEYMLYMIVFITFGVPIIAFFLFIASLIILL